MLDYRLDTFLKVCEVMNYREAAEQLHITQPAVTQHIHFLEREYDCKLFNYENRKLEKTPSAKILEAYIHSMKYNEKSLKIELQNARQQEFRVGATKTIGDYVVGNYIRAFLKEENHTLTLIVDNTEHLLHLLEENKIDFAIVEGYFDKRKYDYQLFRKEPFVGICRKSHSFAGRTVSMEELLKETLICREEGSGTRAIMEQKLLDFNESISHFASHICISSFKIILELVKEGFGISFGYDVLAETDSELARFYLPGEKILREFNFVYLKNTTANRKIQCFLNMNMHS